MLEGVLVRQVICALDTGNLDEALRITRRMSKYVSSFKIGHALTLPNGLEVVDRLKEAGAERIFLDLKFHDIPNSVALAVREAAKHGVWMMTLHITGGPAMMQAAVEEANLCSEERRPQLIGVSVLTSLDQHTLTEHLGVTRDLEDHMIHLSRLAMDYELDGVVCSPHEVKAIRNAIGHNGIIVTPGIRPAGADTNDQVRTGDAATSIRSGANYLVIGRALIGSDDPEATLQSFGFAKSLANLR
ncbi:MAG: orotidine-5'-phosphate decarboxylase [Fimbriimonadales bacterium]